MKILGGYTNGNYKVLMLEDGTKIRAKEDSNPFTPVFPESIDIKVTNRCFSGCEFCHEKSTPSGDHSKFTNFPFLKTLKPHTELAIGGGDPIEWPYLLSFLFEMRDRGIICNITVKDSTYFERRDFLRELTKEKLIHGIGISTVNPETCLKRGTYLPNLVFHCIAGLVNPKSLSNSCILDIPVLLLGYKQIGRGKDFYSPEIEKSIKELETVLPDILASGRSISFDNLALRQLDVKSKVSPQVWEENFMGDDGQFTMYVDLVKGEYAMSSTSPTRHKITESTIEEMFSKIRKEV